MLLPLALPCLAFPFLALPCLAFSYHASPPLDVPDAPPHVFLLQQCFLVSIGATSHDPGRTRKTPPDEYGSPKNNGTSRNGCSGDTEDCSRPAAGGRALTRSRQTRRTRAAFWLPPGGFLHNWMAFLTGIESPRTRGVSEGVLARAGHHRPEPVEPRRASSKRL